jgi:hypothetical protein
VGGTESQVDIKASLPPGELGAKKWQGKQGQVPEGSSHVQQFSSSVQYARDAMQLLKDGYFPLKDGCRTDC